MTIIGLIIGIMILIGGLYYLFKEKDKESKQIYTIVSIIGLAITAYFAIQLL